MRVFSSSDAPRARGAALLKLILGLAVFVALAVGTLLASLSGGGHEDTSGAALYQVSRQSFEVALTASGDLDARNQTVLRSELETQSSIVEVIPEGTTVKKGDVLVRLSSDELQKQLDNELLSLESAKSDLVSAQNSLEIQKSDNDSALNKAELRLELAKMDMQKWLDGDDKEMKKQLALDIDSAQREADRLREKYERSQKLYENKFLSSDELKQDQLASLKADAALEKAKLRSDVYEKYERGMTQKKKQSEIDEATADLDRVKRRNESQLASQQANVTNKERQLQLRQERVDKLKEQIEATVIKAPTSGMVVYATSLKHNRWDDSGPLEVGTTVRPNEELIVLPNNEEMVARVNIHESLVGQVHKGQRARVKVDAARGKTFDGTVDSVGVIAETGGWRDPNLRQYQVRILLGKDSQDSGLKPSMRCDAEIIVDKVNDALATPVQAIFQEGKVSYVLCPRGDKFARVPVAVGRRSESLAEIVAGLEEGDQVLLRKPRPGEVVPGGFDEAAVAKMAQAAAAARKEHEGKRPGPPGRPHRPATTEAETGAHTATTGAGAG